MLTSWGARALALGCIPFVAAAACSADVDAPDDTSTDGVDSAVVAVKLATCLGTRVLGMWSLIRGQWNSATEAEREHLAEVWSCIASAQDCHEVLGCWYEREPIACAESGAWCEDSWFVYCDGHSAWAQLEDCSLQGEQCLAVGAGAGCGVGTCTVGEFTPYCEDNALMECRGPGVIEKQPCDPHLCFDEDLVCGDEAAAGPCNADPPQPVGFPWCEGDWILTCVSLSVRSRVSCKDLDPDFTCLPNEDCDPYGTPCTTASCGMPVGSHECTAGSNECDGTVLRYCDGGKMRLFDCAAMPGARCVENDCVL